MLVQAAKEALLFYHSTLKMSRMLQFYRTMNDLGREVGRRDVFSDIADLQKYIEKLLQTSAEEELNEAKRGLNFVIILVTVQ